jgi:hypothetical protein
MLEYLKDRVSAILRRAEARHPELLTGKLDKPEHIYQSADDPRLVKPFRYSAGMGLDQFADWATWKNRVSQTVETGAYHSADQLAFWRESLFPFDRSVGFSKVKMTASDLHDEGLGVMLVEFTKPTREGKSKFVIKPEQRTVEAAAFGQHPTSLVNRLNKVVGLDPDRAFTSFMLETHAKFGTLIDFCQGDDARSIAGRGKASPQLWESIALAFVAGLSDAHQDNVFWKDGKAYFIDADNALNWHRMNMRSPALVAKQTGFTQFNRSEADLAYTHLAEVAQDPTKIDPSKSKLLAELVRNARPIVQAIGDSFAGKSGRAVPLVTNAWASALNNSAKFKSGSPADDREQMTRWGEATRRLDTVVNGETDRPSPGLRGETGVAGSGEVYNRDAERAQIFADLDVGKIPYYHYDFDTGFVRHNNVVVWHGQPLREVLAALLAKFPARG